MIGSNRISGIFSHTLLIPFVLAFLQLGLQMAFHDNYGYFRDELYYIACTNHLAFGYVDHPPLSIAALWLNRMLLGDSLYAMRFLPSLAGACVVVLAALTARKLGGGKFAQALAALSVVAAPGLFGHAQLYTMNPFDVFFWTAGGYVLVRLFAGDTPKLWVLYGCVVGLGLLNKYTMGFQVAGLAAGLLLTRQRKHFASPWLWLGAAAAGLIVLPHLLWEIAHDFATLEFLRNAALTKNLHLGAAGFFLGQVQDMNIVGLPLWLGGIYFFFRDSDGRYRPLAWLFPVVFLLMVAGNGKVYYMSSIFPLFLAGGSVLFGRFALKKSRAWLKPAYAGALIVSGLASLPYCLPFLTVEQFIAYQRMQGMTPRADERFGVAELPQYLADQFGWKEFTDTVFSVYKKLTPEEQSQCVIYVRNYGQAGAIDFFGKNLGLPNATCAHNSYWMWGPGEHTGDIAIIVGSRSTLEENFADLRKYYASVEFVSRTNSKYVMPFERDRMIFICKGMNTTFQKIWAKERFYI